MKSGIFILLTILTIFWSSCSNEIPVGEGEQVRDMVLTTTFDVEGVETKSGGVVEADEKNVQSLTVFVFRNGDRDTLISKVTKSDITDLSTIKLDIKAKSGKVKLVALANISSIGDVKTYAELSKKVVSTTDFVSAKLPKFAILDKTLKVELGVDKNPIKPVIQMTLTQLAARVDVKHFVVKGYGDKTFEFKPTTIQVEGINGASSVLLGTYEGSDYSYNTAKSDPLLRLDNASSFYTFEQNANIDLTISGTLTETTLGATNVIEKQKKYALSLIPSTNKGDETNGFVHGYKYEATGTINVQNEAITYDLKVTPWGVEKVEVDYGK